MDGPPNNDASLLSNAPSPTQTRKGDEKYDMRFIIVRLLQMIGACVVTSLGLDQFIAVDRMQAAFPTDCASSLSASVALRNMAAKGLTIDATTYDCPHTITRNWPHTEEPINIVRFFVSYDPGRDVDETRAARRAMINYIKYNKVKVLLGSPISCDPVADEKAWLETLRILKSVDRSSIFGLAIGNEVDLLKWQVNTTQQCLNDLWEKKRFVDVFMSRAGEVWKMPGYENVSITTIVTPGVMFGTGGGEPFVNQPGCRMNDFFKEVYYLQSPNIVFSINLYPYFNPNMKLDPDTTDKCAAALDNALCYDQRSCEAMVSLELVRMRLRNLTGSETDRIWVGGIGWSAPQSTSLAGTMAKCPQFSSHQSMRRMYENFLGWDMKIAGSALLGPEFAFYHSFRDVYNNGMRENFGLIEGNCTSSRNTCKMDATNVVYSHGNAPIAAATDSLAVSNFSPAPAVRAYQWLL